MLATGSVAPNFTATLDDGSTFDLAAYRGQKHVVLYFYPKDFTAGCTREACAFRDNYAEIEKHDALIIGVSGDTAESHLSFRDHHTLPFPLIADPEKKLIRLYEARGLFGLLTARITYVIDKQGVIRAAFRHDLAVARHVPEVIEALRKITGASAQPGKA